MKINLLIITVLSFILSIQAQSIQILKDIAVGADDGINFYNAEFGANSKFIYFVGQELFNPEIYQANGTSGNATRLGFNDSIYSPENLAAVGNKLFFIGRTDHKSLFVYDENSRKIIVLLDVSGGDDFQILPFRNTGILYLRSKTFSSKPDQIWYSDGTVLGTKKIYESDSFPSVIDYSTFQNSLVISDGSTSFDQAEAIICDGTPGGTMLVKDFIKSKVTVDVVDDAIGSEGSLVLYTVLQNGTRKNFILTSSKSQDLGNIGSLEAAYSIGGKVIIYMDKAIQVYDTQTAQLSILKEDIGSFQNTYGAKTKVYFTVDGTSSKELYETDGTKAGTVLVNDNIEAHFISSFGMISNGSKVHYFRNISRIVELWEYNIATRSNTKITELFTSPSAAFKPVLFYFFNNKVIFGKDTKAEGFELWIYNLGNVGVKNENRNKSICYFNSYTNELIINSELQDEKWKITIVDAKGCEVLTNNTEYQNNSIRPTKYLCELFCPILG